MGWFSDLLKEYPALSVAKERVDLAEARLAALEDENAKLRDENERLFREVTALRKQVPTNDFVEHKGMLFKRIANGSFDGLAYCPTCKLSLSTIEPNFIPLRCSKCKWMSSFLQTQLAALIQDIPA